MADLKISQLPAVADAHSTDELPIARSNTTKKLTVQQIVDEAQTGVIQVGTAAGGALSGTYPDPDFAAGAAGAGLSLSGVDTLAVNVDGTTIEITADALNVKSGVFQPLDATLTALAASNWALNAIPIGTGADTLAQTSFAANTFPARSSAGNLAAKTITDFGLSLVDDADNTAARTTLGLGSIATQASNNVTITGGSITGITDLAVADGGTGASTAGAALVALGATPSDGWIDDTAATWTFATASTFTVTGDRTAVFSKGTRLKFTQTTVKYAVVVLSSHSAGTTTVTIAVNTDYTIANAAISANYYSYAENPQGYPGWFNYAPTYTGFSADPSGGSCIFMITGKLCVVHHSRNDGTSNANTFTISLPATSVGFVPADARIINNGVEATVSGMVVVAEATSTTLNVHRSYAIGSAAWTTSGAKNAQFIVSYPI